MKYKKKSTVFQVNILYLVLGILLLTVGGFVQSRELYLGLLITEYFLILLPSLLFIKLSERSIKEVLRLNRIGIKQVLLVIGITIFTYPIAVLFQAIFLGIINMFKEITPSTVPMPNDGLQYLISFLIIAMSPGICEEVFFRGVILNSYGHLGYYKSIFLTAVLFGMFHFNLLNFVGPTILGVVFGIMVYKTNSLYSSIIGHTVNNGIALTIGFLFNRYEELIDELTIDYLYSSYATPIGVEDFVPMLLLIICFLIVKSLFNRLEPVDGNVYESNVEIDLNDKGTDVYEEDVIGSRTKSIQYSPIVIVVLMFILMNWINLFM